MPLDKEHYYRTLATYFASKPLYLDAPIQKKPNTRKLVEQPWQQTKGKLWDEVIDTLCNLDFIQAKAAAKMTYELVKDFNAVFFELPDNAENVREESKRKARLNKYAMDLLLYAKGISPVIEIPETVTLWNEERIYAEIERIKTNTTRLDRLNEFYKFLGQEAGNLQKYAWEFSHFATQQAWNYSNSGPLGISAEKNQKIFYKSLLVCIKENRSSWDPLPQAIYKLKGYHDPIYKVSLTPDGKRAISESGANFSIIWDLDTGQPIYTLKGRPASSVTFTPDGTRAITFSVDKTYNIWDLNTGRLINILNGHNESLIAITPDGKQVIVVSEEKKLIFLDVNTGKVNKTIGGPTGFKTDISITLDCKRAIYRLRDDTYVLWDLSTERSVNTWQSKNSNIETIAITPDGNKAFFANNNHPYYTCTIYDLVTMNKFETLKGHKNSISSVAITPDGRRAISASIDQTCIIWDIDSGKAINTLKGHTGHVHSVDITPDGYRAISGSGDGTCIVWDLNTIPASFTGHALSVNSVATTPDGKTAISGSNDFTCIHWDLSSGKAIKTTGRITKGHNRAVYSVNITPDGQRAISGSDDETCIIWDLKTGDEIYRLLAHTRTISSVVITPDGRRAISCSGIERFSNDKYFSPSKWIKEVSKRPNDPIDIYTCIIWDMSTGKSIHTLKGHTNCVSSIAITPDGKRAITGSWDRTYIIWDLDSGQAVNTWKGHDSIIEAISISPDGQKAISTYRDNACIIWDLKTGQAIKELMKYNVSGGNITYTPDGKKIISSFSDNSCIIWEVEGEKRIGIFVTNSSIHSISSFPGGILIGTESGKVFILNANKELLCKHGGIVTIRRTWDYELKAYKKLSVDCCSCGYNFVPEASVFASIKRITAKISLKRNQSPCLEFPKEAWDEPGLSSNCPKCGEKLKFNPFIASGEYKPNPKWKFW